MILFKKNIKLKLVLNNAVLKGWKAAIFMVGYESPCRARAAEPEI